MSATTQLVKNLRVNDVIQLYVKDVENCRVIWIDSTHKGVRLKALSDGSKFIINSYRLENYSGLKYVGRYSVILTWICRILTFGIKRHIVIPRKQVIVK